MPQHQLSTDSIAYLLKKHNRNLPNSRTKKRAKKELELTAYYFYASVCVLDPQADPASIVDTGWNRFMYAVLMMCVILISCLPCLYETKTSPIIIQLKLSIIRL